MISKDKKRVIVSINKKSVDILDSIYSLGFSYSETVDILISKYGFKEFNIYSSSSLLVK